MLRTFLVQPLNFDAFERGQKVKVPVFRILKSDRNCTRPSSLPSQPYAKTYAEGNEAYSRQEYATVIRKMETALKQYFQAEEDCRYKCEDILQSSGDETKVQHGLGGE